MLIQFWRDETREWRPKGRQDEVIHGHIGLKGEQIAERWLKTRGFSIIESHTKHPHAGPYDIKAQKSGMVWLFEVKYGTKPPVAIQNLVRMYNERGAQKLGILFVPLKGIPLLFEMNKMSYAGLKASKTKGKAKERVAGLKAAKKRAGTRN